VLWRAEVEEQKLLAVSAVLEQVGGQVYSLISHLIGPGPEYILQSIA
jgi:hypothetical protein